MKNDGHFDFNHLWNWNSFIIWYSAPLLKITLKKRKYMKISSKLISKWASRSFMIPCYFLWKLCPLGLPETVVTILDISHCHHLTKDSETVRQNVALVRQNRRDSHSELCRTVRRFVARFVALLHCRAFCRTVVGEIATVRNVLYQQPLICIRFCFKTKVYNFPNGHHDVICKSGVKPNF